jgi:predicted porin
MQTNKTLALSLKVAIAGVLATSSARAIDLTADDWKFSVNGNINVHYIYSSCQNASSAVAITTVGGACTGTASGSSVSNIGNGLLPAALTFGISTTQAGIDIAAHFGLYPGISTNDGGSPNLQANGGDTNVGLGTTGLDVRQVFMTFGNKDMGTFTLGRNFGLFGFDAIINDMTLPGVGVAGSASTATPSNTTLGSIGFGYIYVDTLAQINYTTPEFLPGLTFTAGIFDPVNSLTDPGAPAPKKAPGFHFKVAYKTAFTEDLKFYASATGVTQKQDYIAGLGAEQYTSAGGDIFMQLKYQAFEFDGSYYIGKGMGTTGYYILASDGLGHARKSDGYLIQGLYTMGRTKLGVNYGVSKLDFAGVEDAAAVPNLLDKNSKVTAGVYFSLTKNLTLVGEVSRAWTEAHDGGENKSINANAGAFVAF